MTKNELTIAQRRMKQMADRHHSDRTFEVRKEVYLKVKRFQHLFIKGPTSKSSPKYYRPFKITAKIGLVAYSLQFLDGVGLHTVFHVSLLKKAVGTTEEVSREVPKLVEDRIVEVEPQTMLDKRMVYKDSLPLT